MKEPTILDITFTELLEELIEVHIDLRNARFVPDSMRKPLIERRDNCKKQLSAYMKQFKKK